MITLPDLALPCFTDDQFVEFCEKNRDLRIERSAKGEIRIMPPSGGESGYQNASIITLVTVWSWKDGTGTSFDSSTGFTLPNGALNF